MVICVSERAHEPVLALVGCIAIASKRAQNGVRQLLWVLVVGAVGALYDAGMSYDDFSGRKVKPQIICKHIQRHVSLRGDAQLGPGILRQWS